MAIGRTNTGGGGGRYSLLTVTTAEATLQTASVTITGTDSTSGKTDTQTKSMVGGSVSFKLKFLTSYTITCGTVTKVLNVPYYGDYSVQISLALYFIKNGIWQNVGGGWSAASFSYGSASQVTMAETLTGDVLKLFCTRYDKTGKGTNNKITIGYYTKMGFEGYASAVGGTTVRGGGIGFVTAKSGELNNVANLGGIRWDAMPTSMTDTVVDISGIGSSTEVYPVIAFSAGGDGSGSSIFVKNWYLTR